MADIYSPAGHGDEVGAAAEARWTLVVAIVTLFLVGMMGYMSLHWAAMPPVRTETVDPGTLHIAGEFIETNLGTFAEADGSATVRVLANQYSFTPQCIVVPADMPVLFRGTAADVVHGFSISASNVNLMLVPGFVTKLRTRFERTGEYLMPCHEFCGNGHAAMWAHVKVIDRESFMRQSRGAGGKGVSCVQ